MAEADAKELGDEGDRDSDRDDTVTEDSDTDTEDSGEASPRGASASDAGAGDADEEDSPRGDSANSASANELVLANHIGDRGFNQIAEKTMEGERLVYNINEEHNVFRYENLPNFSTKIAKIVKNVMPNKKAKYK